MSEDTPSRFATDATHIPLGVSPVGRDGAHVVTGATRGIGRATAVALAKLGAEVVLVGRDESRLDAARTECERANPNAQVFGIRADFASLASVRRAGAEIVERWPAIRVLVNNAGVNSPTHETTADGHELTFQVNCLSPFLLTTLLVPALATGAPSRVIDVTSVFAHFGSVDVADLMFERRRYSSTRAYTQSKLATAMLAVELSERLRETGVAVNCVSPALVATDLLRDHWYSAAWLRPMWSRFLLTPEAAAERIVRVATSDALTGVSGQWFAASIRPVPMPRAVRDAKARRRVWDAVVGLTGVVPALPARAAKR